MKTYKNFLVELFDNPYPTKPVPVGDYARKFKTKEGHEYTVFIDQGVVLFQDEEGAIGITGTKGPEAAKIISTVLSVVREFIQKKSPPVLKFTAFSDDPSRVKLYTRMLKKFAPDNYNIDITQGSDEVKYQMIKKKKADTTFTLNKA